MTDFSQENPLKYLNMLAIQSGIAKYRCLCIQGAVAFQTPGVFFFYSPGTKILVLLYLGDLMLSIGPGNALFLVKQIYLRGVALKNCF